MHAELGGMGQFFQYLILASSPDKVIQIPDPWGRETGALGNSGIMMALEWTHSCSQCGTRAYVIKIGTSRNKTGSGVQGLKGGEMQSRKSS